MSEHYRALIVILILASVIFGLLKTHVTEKAISKVNFLRRRNCWYAVTIAGFLAPNFWLLILLAAIILFHYSRTETSPVSLFFFSILALPQIRAEIPGIGGIRYFFDIDYIRLLTLIVLLPVCISLLRSQKKRIHKYFIADILLILFIILNLTMRAQYDNATGITRSLFYWIIDVVVPYYTISRSIRSIGEFRDVIMSFVVAAMVASSIAIFEFFKRWLLYSSLESSLDVEGAGIYLLRGDYLRAIVTSGQPIPFGFVIATALGLFFFLQWSIPRRSVWITGFLLLICGIIAPLSRGPWVGLIVMILVYLSISPRRIQHFSKISLLLPVVSIFILATDMGGKVLDYLPFVGTVDEKNVEYREELFDSSIKIVLDNPIFGSTDYLLQLEHMRQGQGIIDLVNTYLIVALNTGFVGLFIYIAFFFSILLGILKAIRRLQKDSEIYCLGQALVAVILGILVILGTVSPVNQIPLLYWSIAAMGMAYRVLVMNLNSEKKADYDYLVLHDNDVYRSKTTYLATR